MSQRDKSHRVKPTHIRHLMIGPVRQAMMTILKENEQNPRHHTRECNVLKELRHESLTATNLASEGIQTFILLTAPDEYLHGLTPDQFRFFMAKSTLPEYKDFSLQQSASIKQFCKRRVDFIRSVNGLFGLPEDRTELFNLILLRMKPVPGPEEHEISYKHWLQRQRDRKRDNIDETTPLSERFTRRKTTSETVFHGGPLFNGQIALWR